MKLGCIVKYPWTILLLSIAVKAVPRIIRDPSAPEGAGNKRLQFRDVVPVYVSTLLTTDLLDRVC
jgi:hypothetical protein